MFFQNSAREFNLSADNSERNLSAVCWLLLRFHKSYLAEVRSHQMTVHTTRQPAAAGKQALCAAETVYIARQILTGADFAVWVGDFLDHFHLCRRLMQAANRSDLRPNVKAISFKSSGSVYVHFCQTHSGTSWASDTAPDADSGKDVLPGGHSAVVLPGRAANAGRSGDRVKVNTLMQTPSEQTPPIQALEWERISASIQFRELLRQKRRFILPATAFFILYYFALPVLVGYFPEWMTAPVLGPVNVAYLFALSQFVVAWLIAWRYVRAAERFDELALKVRLDSQTSNQAKPFEETK
jgi:uncharacterized membrane protein (DUF485 family)